ncbi:MAG: HYR domain-containing protein [Flavobacteriales bacterium]|nr:HYR domain-containing protein [Flavobacteriales bacterium]
MNSHFPLRALSLLVFLSSFVTFEAVSQVSITCPPDIVTDNDAGLCSAIVTYTVPVGTGTGTNITTTLTNGLPSGSAFPEGTTVVEYTVTNDEGDNDVCTFNVTVNDVEDPVISCPPDIIIDAGPSSCSQTVSFSIPPGVDNCGPVTVTQFGGLPSGSVFPVGESFLDFETTDASGNSAFCRIVVLVNDITPPEINCPDDIVVNVFNSCDTVINYVPPVGTDACGSALTSQIAGLGPGGTYPLGTTVETYEVIDEDGNTEQCSFSITVIDAAPPTISDCPLDISQTVPLGACEDIVTFTAPTALDNCPGVSVVQTGGPTPGSVFPVGPTPVEYTATDAAGNQTVCSFTVTLTEDELPEITCPADIVVSNDQGDCGAIVVYTPPVGIDNCSSPITVQIAGLGSGAFFPIGTTTETYEVVDLSGNTATCSFTITVNDNEAPVIDCPISIEASADPGLCEATVTFPAPAFTDNCPGGSIVQTNGPNSGASFIVGSTTVEFTATDDSGLQTICTFEVIVTDDEAPIITCPDDIDITLVSGACDTIVNYLPLASATDNCGIPLIGLVSGPNPVNPIGPGSYTVTLGATDDASNIAVCSFNIQINQGSPPIFDCPSDIVVTNDPGTCSAVVEFGDPTATDPCSNVTVIQTGGPVSGSIFDLGATEIEFTAEDDFGNTEICTFNVIVTDNEDPSITCPSNISVSNDPTLCGAIVNYNAPITNDNCGVGSVNLLSGLPSGSVFNVGVTSVTYEVIDDSGNTAQCTFEVEVIDIEPPAIDCPDDIIINIPDGDCEGAVTFTGATATDNCSVAAINQIEGPLSGADFPVGVTTITYEAIDVNNLSTTCSFTITVLEEVAPTIVCPSDIIVDNEPNLCGATVIYTPPVGEDDCPGVSTVLTSGLGSGGFFPVGTTTEEYTVTDLSGNTEVCSFEVTVNDAEAPFLSCPEDLTVPADSGLCEATVTFNLPNIADNCDNDLTPVQITGPPNGSTFPLGTTMVTFEATDLGGNVGTCSFNVIVVDEEEPIITCPDDIEINAGVECSTIVNFPDATATDNCGVPSITQIEGPLSGSEFPIGETTIIYEASDDSGNSTTCSFTVTVTEDDAPTIICPENLSVEASAGLCEAVVTYDPPIAFDDCGDVTLSLIGGISSGDVFPVGTTVVTFEAEDGSGNIAICTFEVTVIDTQAPVFECPEDVIIANEIDGCGASFTFENPLVSDNCPNDVVVVQTGGPASGTFLPIGTTTFSFEGTDEVGNIASCSFDVTVVDDQNPVFINCPEGLVIDLAPSSCDSAVVFETPFATDNCAVEEINQTNGPSSGDLLGPGTYNIEFEAIDEAGNSAICAFTIEVNDITAPVIACPESFKSCETVVTLPLPEVVGECSEVAITQIEGPESGSVFAIGINTITFEITDESDNSTLCSFEVEVFEPTTRPTLGPDQGICDSTTTLLVGNQPDFGFGTWFQITGSGEIEDPLSPVTSVTNLSVGTNTFIWSIDPDNGCDILSDSIRIFVEDGVVVDAGADDQILIGSTANLFGFVSPPNGSIEWSPPDNLSCIDCVDPVAAPTQTTVYTLAYTTPLGCLQTDSLEIKVYSDIPNTITPDDDGVNDVWNIPEIEKFPNASVQIFNRWGIEVFSSNGYNEPWDGKKDNEELPTGSYFYMINYNVEGVENLNGTVTLIR